MTACEFPALRKSNAGAAMVAIAAPMVAVRNFMRVCVVVMLLRRSRPELAALIGRSAQRATIAHFSWRFFRPNTTVRQHSGTVAAEFAGYPAGQPGKVTPQHAGFTPQRSRQRIATHQGHTQQASRRRAPPVQDPQLMGYRRPSRLTKPRLW
jgi:hypothetical protein